ncbi:MAG: ribokinase, partial [Nitrosopumilaceae archaeon]|nr:ribokinase [Nitrosopumilaceae archaeon]
MNISIFSHCAIDSISLEGSTYEQIGGAACYCAMMARQFKFDVDLHTKFGADFPTQYFSDNKINYDNSLSQKPTTRFEIDISGIDRTLKLKHECEPIEISSFDSDGTIVSPIYHEISDDNYEKIKSNSNFLLVDPQGFLRTNSGNIISLQKRDLNLSNVSAIKVNTEEIACLVDKTGDDGMIALQKKGVENVILTNKINVSLLVKD